MEGGGPPLGWEIAKSLRGRAEAAAGIKGKGWGWNDLRRASGVGSQGREEETSGQGLCLLESKETVRRLSSVGKKNRRQKESKGGVSEKGPDLAKGAGLERNLGKRSQGFDR